MQFMAKRFKTMHSEHLVIGTGGTIEGKRLTLTIEVLSDLALVLSHHKVAARRDLDILPGTPGTIEADLYIRQ